MGKWNGRISKRLEMSFNHFWSNNPIMNLHFHQMKSKWNGLRLFTYLKSADCADCLHIQSQLIVLIAYIFKVSWLFTFSKSTDCKELIVLWRFRPKAEGMKKTLYLDIVKKQINFHRNAPSEMISTHYELSPYADFAD